MDVNVDAMTPAQRDMFFNGPAHTPPNGTSSNFDNPKDLVVEFIIMCTICSVVTGVFVVIRFYTRWKLTRRFLLEDLVLLLGWLLFVSGFNSPVFLAEKVHLGAHQWDIRIKDFVMYLKFFHWGTLFFDITMLLLRLAIIMQVLRHFVPSGARNFTFWAAHFLIATNMVFWISITFMELYQCKPRRKIWEFYLHGKCIDKHWYMAATGAMNLISEMAIMFLPQRIIWSLTLSTKRKLELTPLFMVGTFTCICSAIRLWQIIVRWDPHGDITYYMADAVMIWTVPEIASCVLVSCLPSFPQFIRIVRNKPLTTRSHSSMMQVDRSSWSGPQRKHHNPSEVITDREYHELVMRTETTIASAEREDRGPWVQTPATVLIRGGKGPTKKFVAPSYYPR